MVNKVQTAFEPQMEMLSVSALLPLKAVSPTVRASPKYQQIVASIAAVGIIEPLVVARPRDRSGRYLLLDGHLRLSVLVDSGIADVRCLISRDDEAFTYNKRINRLATIQEHHMIVRAIDRGVSEDRLAKALNLDVRALRRRRMMLLGISPEVVDLLKDRSVSPTTFSVLRKMRPMRQVEAAELMNTAGNHTSSYAKALLAATRQADLVKSELPKKVAGLTAEQMARMEREMEGLQQDVKSVESRYGDDVLHLVVAAAYIGKLVGNTAINSYMARHHPELLAELSTVVSAASLDEGHST